jgi:NAD(P)-dependent dehydrogenase (short-subunit alcohol dehydrogenase family)
MSKKNAIITGGAGNLGRAVVKKFLESGYRVAVTLEPNVQVDEQFRNQSPDLDLYELDVTDEKKSEVFVKQCAEKYGRIDAVVMLVGGFALGTIKEISQVSVEKMLRLNFYSALAIAKPSFEEMKIQKGGRLIFIGARAGLDLKNGTYAVEYGLSKSLLFRLSELFNAEGNAVGVVSSVVVPSVIDTPVNRASMPTANFDDWVKPEVIAESIMFLCSDAGGALRDTVLKVYHNA